MSLLSKCVGFWCFEETSSPSIDSTGRGNDLTWAGANVAAVPGVINYGLYAIWSGNYAAIATNDDVQPGPRESFTLAGWFKPNAAWEGLGSQVLCGKVGVFQVGLSVAFGYHLYFYCSHFPANIEVTVPFDPGEEWFFWRAWRDADAKTINLQVNCGTISSVAYDEDLPQGAYEFFVGGGPAGGYYEYTAGATDALGFWKRVLDTSDASLLCPGIEYPFGVCGVIVFGDYTFGNTWHPANDDFEWTPAIGKLPRAHGSRALDFYLPEKRILIRGGEIKGPFDTSDLRPRIDAIKNALAAAPQNLQIEPDRYFRDVRVGYFRNPYGPTHYCRIAAEMEIEFIARDPFQYALLPSSDTWSSPTTGATRTITAGGTIPAGKYIAAQPTFSITVGGAGAQTIDYTLKNNTTGQQFRLSGDVTGGQVIVVDTLDQTVQIGTTDEIALFDGEFVSFDYGANAMEVTIVTGSISQIRTTWRNRFL